MFVIVFWLYIKSTTFFYFLLWRVCYHIPLPLQNTNYTVWRHCTLYSATCSELMVNDENKTINKTTSQHKSSAHIQFKPSKPRQVNLRKLLDARVAFNQIKYLPRCAINCLSHL